METVRNGIEHHPAGRHGRLLADDPRLSTRAARAIRLAQVVAQAQIEVVQALEEEGFSSAEIEADVYQAVDEAARERLRGSQAIHGPAAPDAEMTRDADGRN